VERFEHHAPFDAEHSRVEMRLVSRTAQRVTVGGRRFAFAEGDTIVTEHSQKYDLSAIARLAEGAFELEHAWVDAAHYFSVQYLRAV
jgi:uncharacterized SAM-dependent methyltransferase